MCRRSYRFNCSVSRSWVIRGISETEVCVVIEILPGSLPRALTSESVSSAQKIKSTQGLPTAEANCISKVNLHPTSLLLLLYRFLHAGVWLAWCILTVWDSHRLRQHVLDICNHAAHASVQLQPSSLATSYLLLDQFHPFPSLTCPALRYPAMPCIGCWVTPSRSSQFSCISLEVRHSCSSSGTEWGLERKKRVTWIWYLSVFCLSPFCNYQLSWISDWNEPRGHWLSAPWNLDYSEMVEPTL